MSHAKSKLSPVFSPSRRRFLQAAGALSTGPFIQRATGSPNGKVQHASFGAAGMAGTDLRKLAAHPDVKLVAVADVDLARTAQVKAEFPDVRIYQDWRELLEKEGAQIDSCNVSTPDHMHAIIAMQALQRGKHVYCQKPLAHNLSETRKLREKAASTGLVTQMGTQLASYTSDLSTQAWIQAGAIGKVRQVHTFSGKTWGDPNPLPEREDPIPPTLDWDLWNGVADPVVRYLQGAYHPGQWRKRQAFGTGTLGDMGCHMFNGWFRSLGLAAPLSVRSNGPAPRHGNWAVDGEIHYVFPGTQYTSEKTIEVIWYDGAKRPPAEIVGLLGETFPREGSVYVGEEGILLAPHGGWVRIFRGGKLVEQAVHRFKDVPGTAEAHWFEFIDAILGRTSGKPPKSNFGFAGPLTEAVLLGNVSTFFPGETLVWNTADLKFPEKAEANQLLSRTYRQGWQV
ncbi:MAG: putative dehydrogenase [Verrucomicrobia bacterium]|nr:MAG: putative dehydrogenase [Verrucomicrobiota bacterium]